VGFDQILEGCFSVCEDFSGFDICLFVSAILFSDVLFINHNNVVVQYLVASDDMSLDAGEVLGDNQTELFL